MNQSERDHLSFGAIPTYIYYGVPVTLSWSDSAVDYPEDIMVSISEIFSPPTSSTSDVRMKKPMNLTLCLSKSLGSPPVSTISSNLVGSNYTWTPSGSLTNGNYSFEISKVDEIAAYSDDVIISGGEPNDTSSDTFQVSTLGTAFFTPTYSTGTASSTRVSATDSFNSISSAATGHSSSLAYVTAKVTPAAAPAGSSQSTSVQNVSVIQNPISNRTIAGIVVGAVLFLLLTTASATLYWRRRRRSSQTAVSELPAHQTDNEVKSDPAIWIPELDQEGAVYGPHELADTPTPMAQSLRSLEATESQPA